MDGGAPEVKVAVVPWDNVDLELPPCGRCVTGHRVLGLPPDLHANVDAIELDAGPVSKPDTRKIDPLDDDAHNASLAHWSSQGPPPQDVEGTRDSTNMSAPSSYGARHVHATA